MSRPFSRRSLAPGRSGVRRTLSASLLALALPAISLAQSWPDTGADAVESFTAGTGAGYGAQYFPGNVLGLPDSTGRAGVASVEPKQILGLGLGGVIVLRFDRAPIVDIPGPDFTVFENAFENHTSGSPPEKMPTPPCSWTRVSGPKSPAS